LLRPVSTTSSPANVHNTLSNLRSSITRRMQFRRSVRNSTSAGTLPTPDSASRVDDVDSDNRDHYVPIGRQTHMQQSTDSLESNSSDAIAARYADHQVPNPPTVSAEGIDVPLPVTTAPSQPARLMTSISTTGSVGGAMAAGVDADYLAVSVDQQKNSSPVSRQVLLFTLSSCSLSSLHKCNITTIQSSTRTFLLVLQLCCTCAEACNTTLQYKFSTTCSKLAGYLQQL